MKVILLRDVAKIGKRYEIVNVPDGFALNKLIPKKDAEAATPANIKRVTNMRQKGLSDKNGLIQALKKIVTDLSESPLQVPMQANEKGHLFQSVHSEDIVTAAQKRGIRIQKELVVIESPIKSTGDHVVLLKSHGEALSLPISVVVK